MSKGPWKRPKQSNDVSPLSSELKNSKDSQGFSKDQPSRTARNVDGISKALNVLDENYYVKMRWAWFFKNEYGVNYALEVDRFYPSKSLAIDIEQYDEELCVYKRKILEAHSIRYVRIQDLLSVHDLVGIQ